MGALVPSKARGLGKPVTSLSGTPATYVIKIPWGNDGKPGLVQLDRRH